LGSVARSPTTQLALPLRPIEGLAQVQEPGSASGEARGGGGLGQAMTSDLAGQTFFPAGAVPLSLAIAFLPIMMAHAAFEREVRSLQSSVARDPNDPSTNFGEQARNRWDPRKRAELMIKLIEEKLGQIPETEAIAKLLDDAVAPNDARNDLAHGTSGATSNIDAVITTLTKLDEV
jgi:hypothetical protein